jgi:hypothetical protein
MKIRALPVEIAQWPCGCVVVLGSVIPYAEDFSAAACAWCDATFSVVDLRRWFQQAETISPAIGANPTLLRVGERVVQAMPSNDLDVPYVRDLAWGARWRHLNVPMSQVKVLRD